MGNFSSKSKNEKKPKPESGTIVPIGLPDLNESFHGNAPNTLEDNSTTLKKQLSCHPKSARKISNPSTPNSKSSINLTLTLPNEELIKPVSIRRTIEIPISDSNNESISKPLSTDFKTGSNSQFF
jgi:hypothetical protein